MGMCKSACNARLLVVRFKGCHAQFILPTTVGTTQQHEILKHIHVPERHGRLVSSCTSLEKLFSRDLVLAHTPLGGMWC